ncbi:phosphorylase [Leptospira alexanderi]|uniref:Phosphorylase domain protein n=1 Tax=Leptospira alexanderi serovar Manhao 3 str. L 60 TaxID=1049759 RepID=V6IFN9_9LEPT|nr:phosphorylase [Leptospira alexanderi]EQA63653.1 phosphorylase domain protein [Leptospira alexanderi serovar Manhao 3 str. L 60]
MIFISAALFPEAKPLIETLGLKILRNKTPFPIYRNEKYILVVSGTGKIFSAMSVAFLLNEFKNSVVDSSWILNFGICGAPKESFKIGESFLIHKIKDEGSSRSVYPDILFKSPIPESVLLTVDKPVFRNEISELPNTLVDMEAFGFFQASRKFFSSDKIRIVKTISDHFTKLESEKEIGVVDTISLRIKEALPNILSILSIPVSKGNEVELQQNEIAAFLFITEFLRLSETEKIQLKDWMIGYKIRTGNSSEQGLNILKSVNGTLNLKETEVRTREEGRKGLYALRQFYQS